MRVWLRRLTVMSVCLLLAFAGCASQQQKDFWKEVFQRIGSDRREPYREFDLETESSSVECSLCDGTGLVKCFLCGGSGKYGSGDCSTCKGRGLKKCLRCNEGTLY